MKNLVTVRESESSNLNKRNYPNRPSNYNNSIVNISRNCATYGNRRKWNNTESTICRISK